MSEDDDPPPFTYLPSTPAIRRAYAALRDDVPCNPSRVSISDEDESDPDTDIAPDLNPSADSSPPPRNSTHPAVDADADVPMLDAHHRNSDEPNADALDAVPQSLAVYAPTDEECGLPTLREDALARLKSSETPLALFVADGHVGVKKHTRNDTPLKIITQFSETELRRAIAVSMLLLRARRANPVRSALLIAASEASATQWVSAFCDIADDITVSPLGRTATSRQSTLKKLAMSQFPGVVVVTEARLRAGVMDDVTSAVAQNPFAQSFGIVFSECFPTGEAGMRSSTSVFRLLADGCADAVVLLGRGENPTRDASVSAGKVVAFLKKNVEKYAHLRRRDVHCGWFSPESFAPVSAEAQHGVVPTVTDTPQSVIAPAKMDGRVDKAASVSHASALIPSSPEGTPAKPKSNQPTPPKVSSSSAAGPVQSTTPSKRISPSASPTSSLKKRAARRNRSSRSVRGDSEHVPKTHRRSSSRSENTWRGKKRVASKEHLKSTDPVTGNAPGAPVGSTMSSTPMEMVANAPSPRPECRTSSNALASKDKTKAPAGSIDAIEPQLAVGRAPIPVRNKDLTHSAEKEKRVSAKDNNSSSKRTARANAARHPRLRMRDQNVIDVDCGQVQVAQQQSRKPRSRRHSAVKASTTAATRVTTNVASAPAPGPTVQQMSSDDVQMIDSGDDEVWFTPLSEVRLTNSPTASSNLPRAAGRLSGGGGSGMAKTKSRMAAGRQLAGHVPVIDLELSESPLFHVKQAAVGEEVIVIMSSDEEQ